MKINKAQKDESEQNKAKQSETKQVKTKNGDQWAGLCYYSCLASNVVSFDSTETPKLAVLLF
jgi:hypothetical protein